MHRSTRDIIDLPAQSEVESELLFYLNGSRPMEPASIYGPLADQMNLNSLQRHAQMHDGRVAWNNRVQFARRRLADLGFMDKSQYGLWSLTTAGREEAERRKTKPRLLNLDDLDI